VRDVDVRPLTASRWPDFVDLFERRGPRGGHRNSPAYGCWCMFWRSRRLAHGTPKKRAMGAIVRGGVVPGLLAYSGGEAVGWVSVSPREEYEALVRSPQYRPRDEDEGVWSIVCFVVDKPAQGSGIAGALLDAAVAYARKQGAAAVEAYPHASKPDDYMGRLDLFRARGFRPARKTSSRAVVRLALS
jgi:GNAT superfamily N-acetyltransferase